MKSLRYFSIVLSVLCVLMGCNNESSITISAAASTSDALEDVIHAFNESHPDITVDTNYGGSGALKVQIEQGAPVDLYLSANVSHFNELIDSGLIGKNHLELLKNELVLITPNSENTIQSIEDLVNVDRISIGNPESVPAGQYSKEALEWYDMWDSLSNQLILAEDVRQVLSYVELGEVDAGLVYLTDAATSNSVDIVTTLDSDSHAPIVYPLGVLNDDNDVMTFYQFTQSEAALTIFENYGFTAK